MRIIKFGGSSVASAARMRNCASIVAMHRREAPVTVVVSAMAGVTDALLCAAHAAVRGDPSWREELARVEARHRASYQELAGAVPPLFEVTWRNVIADAEWTARSGLLPGTVEARFKASQFSGWGERLAVPLFATALAVRGMSTEPFSGEPVLLETRAAPDKTPCPSVLATRGWLVPQLARLVMRGGVPVLPGYIVRDADGQITTLGRNGSDHSAAVIAAALGAHSVYIYSDVAGFYSADPRTVPDATLLTEITYREAAEVAERGARVLHPRTLAPLAHFTIPLYLRSSLTPDASGTDVVPRRIDETGMAWVVAARPVANEPGDPLADISATLLGDMLRTLENGEPLLVAAARDVSASSTCTCVWDVTSRHLRVLVPAANTVETQQSLHAALQRLSQPLIMKSALCDTAASAHILAT